MMDEMRLTRPNQTTPVPAPLVLSTQTFGAAAPSGPYIDWETEPGNLVGRNTNTGPWNSHPRYPESDGVPMQGTESDPFRNTVEQINQASDAMESCSLALTSERSEDMAIMDP